MSAKASKPERIALYLRVSTSEQTTRNQRRELRQVAERHGWDVVATFEDAGMPPKTRFLAINGLMSQACFGSQADVFVPSQL
jgi:Resolvase, N terminal domain